ncbi:MAG: transglutaminase domain-containing protein [Actinomycetota bacterium]|nr:transglutaminase domain-containing protein [Actinomycetota bacterium]
MRNRKLKIAALLVTLLIVLSYFALWGRSAKLSLYKQLLEAACGEEESAEKDGELEHELDAFKEEIERGASAEELGESALALEEALSDLNAEITETKESQEVLFEELGITGEVLERHEAFYADYEKKVSAIEERLTELESGGLPESERSELATDIGELWSEREPEILAGELPWRSINLDQGAPAQAQGSASGFSTDNYTIPEDPPSGDDLAETPDIVFTQEITDLAASLDNDPMKIYTYVRNNLDFEPYYGSRKGAHITLLEGSGNGADLASLLIALLRVSGYPARYAYGTICLKPEEAQSWVGTDDFMLACEIFAYNGIPAQAVVYGDEPLAIYLEHTWVETYLPYENYRGDIVTEEGPRWIPLDASFKTYEQQDSVNLSVSVPFDRLSYLTSGADLATDYFTDLCYDAYYQTYPDGNDPESIFASRTIDPEELAILPETLPYTAALSDRYSSLPEHLRERITLTLTEEGGQPSLTYSSTTSELLGKRLTLSYEPASDADRDALRATQDGKIPAYAIEVVPRIKLDGEVVAEGPPVGLGKDQYLSCETCWAAPSPEARQSTSFENEIPAGNYIGMGINAGEVPAELVEASSSRLYQSQERVDAGEDVDPDDTVGELLYRNAIDYLRKVDLAQKPLADLMHARLVRHTSIALSEINSGVDLLAGSPRYLYLDGMIMDVDQLFSSVYMGGDDGAQERKFANIAGCAASELEHLIFERGDRYLGIPSVSAMQILKMANAQGMDIYQVNSSNISSVLPLIDAPASIKEDIADDVHQGKEIIIHSSQITHYDWSGYGWITEDPATTGAAYMIAGGIAGGSTAGAGQLESNVQGMIGDPVAGVFGCAGDGGEQPGEEYFPRLSLPDGTTGDSKAICESAYNYYYADPEFSAIGGTSEWNSFVSTLEGEGIIIKRSNVYPLLIEKRKLPCIGVPAITYCSAGLDMRNVFPHYLDFGMDGQADDANLTLQCGNWDKYFYYRGSVKYHVHDAFGGNNGVNYENSGAKPGDIILVDYGNEGGKYTYPIHSALVTKVEDGKVMEVVGMCFDGGDDRYRKMKIYKHSEDDFFEKVYRYPIAIVGYNTL